MTSSLHLNNQRALLLNMVSWPLLLLLVRFRLCFLLLTFVLKTIFLHFNIIAFPLYSILPYGCWIVDSGATSHVCSDLSLFSEVCPVSGVTVSLPNGTSVPISHTGTVHISEHLVLQNVLHVDSFKFNLLSVSSLLQNRDLCTHVYYDSWFIQDHIRDLTIGKGLLMHGLYILEPLPQLRFEGV